MGTSTEQTKYSKILFNKITKFTDDCTFLVTATSDVSQLKNCTYQEMVSSLLPSLAKNKDMAFQRSHPTTVSVSTHIM